MKADLANNTWISWSNNSAEFAFEDYVKHPRYFISHNNSGCAKYWWIRQGTSDSDTALTVIANLATSLENKGMDVNILFYWDAGHGADEDPEDSVAPLYLNLQLSLISFTSSLANAFKSSSCPFESTSMLKIFIFTGKNTLRVRFELTRCDAPLVGLSPPLSVDLKTSAVGHLATSARPTLLSIRPF